MIKLALVGKTIQHSRSPEIYRNLLGEEIQYDLLDYKEAKDIPQALELLKEYNGISITSPYKKHFLSQIQLTKEASLLGSINCLKFDKGIITGENTDFLAILEILRMWKEKYKKINVIILGDGVMSNVAQSALERLGSIPYKVLSRKLTKHFDQLNTVLFFEKEFSHEGQKIIINTCSRDFIFKGQMDEKSIFWDFNYDFKPHSNSLPSQIHQYIDGIKMLELQARYALTFWSIKAFDLNN